MIFSGTMIPVSTVDWHGRSASVIFFNGCNFRCIYCGNNDFIKATNQLEPLFRKGSIIDLEDVKKQILDIRPFISAVVFSGGEPTIHYKELRYLAKFAKEQGLLVGIETNGYYPDCLESLINDKLLDKIFLDVKAPLDNPIKYKMITGVQDAHDHVYKTLNLNLRGITIEVRTTVFRSLISKADIANIYHMTKSIPSIPNCICTYAIQQGIPLYAPDPELRKEKPLGRDEIIKLVDKNTDIIIRCGIICSL